MTKKKEIRKSLRILADAYNRDVKDRKVIVTFDDKVIFFGSPTDAPRS